ncbi:MAG: hypothetical protein D8B42_10085 [Kingella sp. (in: b-proteobacteria)]|uniref:hypothetical protein n=1 Tax=Kingella oralis TaxID=505 RepID=UPI000F17798E|nr:MAG: hypothetical protein D8B42_10085 [Kingella sp. (in: b-proteobacteria)]
MVLTNDNKRQPENGLTRFRLPLCVFAEPAALFTLSASYQRAIRPLPPRLATTQTLFRLPESEWFEAA